VIAKYSATALSENSGIGRRTLSSSATGGVDLSRLAAIVFGGSAYWLLSPLPTELSLARSATDAEPSARAISSASSPPQGLARA
jgi:hypothetical protein